MTLLETVIALAVFWMCIAGFAALFMQTKQLSDKSRSHYVAVNLAKNEIERAGLYTRPGQLQQLLNINTNPLIMDSHGRPDTEADFRRTTRVTVMSSNLYEMVVDVQIRDKYSLAFGQEKETLQTYFTEYREK